MSYALSEIYALSPKVQRVTSARSVLNGIVFERCPRYTQPLPDRFSLECQVCGQPEPPPTLAIDAIISTCNDLDARTKELQENRR